MKADSWATATSRWVRAADRLSATFSRQTTRHSGLSVAYQPLLHGAFSMDMTWVTGRIAVGGGIWTAENMAAVSRAGITHIIDMQIEFDDTRLAAPHGIEVLWNPIDDDFQPKPPEVFERGVEFATQALSQDGHQAVHSLRGRSPPGADDDAGGVVLDGLDTGCGPGPDRERTPGGGFCGCVCAQRGEVSRPAGESGKVRSQFSVAGSQLSVNHQS